MPRARLDSAFCAAARCEDGKRKTDWYDEAITGFVLECRSTGGKTFYLRYDADGRQKQAKLAAYGDAPFAQVRKKAERLRAEVALGGDPAKAKAEARAVPVYAELAAQHMADAELHQKSYATTEMYVRRYLVARWGKVRLPAGTVETLVKPENKATLTNILTYHVVSGRMTSADISRAIRAGNGTATLTTVEGEPLTARMMGGRLVLTDAKGGKSMVTIKDVMQSNGVIHVVDTVLMP